MPPIIEREEPGECSDCGCGLPNGCRNCGACLGCVGYHSDHEAYCEECGEREFQASDVEIRDSGCRAYPDKQPLKAPYPGFLYLGVELEVECGDSSRTQVAASIGEKYGRDRLLLKDDGSLSNGFEMVTGPWSLEYHQQVWGGIVKAAIEADATSWRRKSTGLHVHMSRAFFTPLVLGKLLVFLNSEQTKAQIVRLAGRESPDYASMEKKKLTDVVRYRSRTDWQTGHTTRTRTAVGFGASGNRYEILNLTNEKTVEVRIFKGTLGLVHILADIEFCHAAAHWTRDVSIQQCESWPSFWGYVLKHRKMYAHLVEYMTKTVKIKEEE